MSENKTQYLIAENGEPMACCGNCVAYRDNPRTNGQGGDCRMNPPKVIVIRSDMIDISGRTKDHINTVFPPVPKTELCMRFVLHPDLGVLAENKGNIVGLDKV